MPALVVAAAVMAITAPPPARACDLQPASHHNATRIIDARTIELDDASNVRLASVLPPTRYDSPAAPASWPPADSALRFLERLTATAPLGLLKEREAPDRYGRFIAHALLGAPPTRHLDPASQPAPLPAPDEAPLAQRWLQARLVAAGHARVDLTPETSTACARRLLALEAEAEQDRRGLWREALYQPKPAADPRALLRLRSTFQIVTGTVHTVAIRSSTIYLNFAEDWQRDFTARIPRTTLRRAGLAPARLDRLTARSVRIRGWIERRGGPLITVWRLEQIEVSPPGATADHDRASALYLATDLATGPPPAAKTAPSAVPAPPEPAATAQ